MLCLLVALVCFLPEVAVFAILRAERAEAHETVPVPTPLKYGDTTELFSFPEISSLSLSASLLVRGQSLSPKDPVFATWISHVTLPVPSGFCPSCQQEDALFLWKANGVCACLLCWQQRYAEGPSAPSGDANVSSTPLF